MNQDKIQEPLSVVEGSSKFLISNQYNFNAIKYIYEYIYKIVFIKIILYLITLYLLRVLLCVIIIINHNKNCLEVNIILFFFYKYN